ncbi:hypothetical protein B0H94_105226 [Salsuginibacillus halophilus]|uniref:Probable membrane transporter protein n=1 Tax=Salsuginibacillus halophilus TaxID=517424 RepID=A0A2P8HLK3_9BACI|nr:sulfite exporter TauE/SafE family protein [Salsuginibacillus halophilus]PSL47070.1 hypothetical protein B0H94_105226 [Salsuginibacillus halophilus]
MIVELGIVFLILFVGSFIQGLSGFGFGLFAMGFLPLLFTLKESTLLVVSLTIVLSFSILLRLYTHIQVKSFLWVLAAAIAGRIGAFFVLSEYGELPVMQPILGIFLCGMVAYLFLRRFITTSGRFIKHPAAPIILGGLAGFAGGVFAIGGPFLVVYFLMLYQDKQAYSANLQASFFITNLFTVIVHGASGHLDTNFLVYFAVGVLCVFLGSSLGLSFFQKISTERVQQLALFIVLIAAVNLIIFGS